MDDLTKRYYTIQEVAALFSVEPPTLRYYEREFPTLNPKRKKSGARAYTAEDIAVLRHIFDLKSRGLKLNAARETLEVRPAREAEVQQTIKNLTEIRAFLSALKARL